MSNRFFNLDLALVGLALTCSLITGCGGQENQNVSIKEMLQKGKTIKTGENKLQVNFPESDPESFLLLSYRDSTIQFAKRERPSLFEDLFEPTPEKQPTQEFRANFEDFDNETQVIVDSLAQVYFERDVTP